MSGVVEKSLSGLFNSLVGSSNLGTLHSSQSSLGLRDVTLGLINFVEKLETARKISKQDEEEFIERETKEWMLSISNQNAKNGAVADILCRSLIAFSRGHYNSNFQIYAIKLTQSNILLQKRIGYLYIDQTLSPTSDLTVLVVNTLHRDLNSPKVLEVAIGLRLIPLISTPDLAEGFVNIIALCLSNQQAYVRKRAAIVCTHFISFGDMEMYDILLPRLLHLLSDTDPSVAIAATTTLASFYKHYSKSDLATSQKTDELHQRTLSSCCHLLQQAIRGNLSKEYNISNTNAPFVQVKMLRCIQNLSSHHCEPPEFLISALDSVFGQPLNTQDKQDLTVYSTKLEGIYTVAHLPKNEGLLRRCLEVIFGFLKSSSIDFKYVGLKAWSSIYFLLDDCITIGLESVLNSVFSRNSVIQKRCLCQLSSMASSKNYKVICSTLEKYALEASSKSQSIHLQILEIIGRVEDVDICWLICFLKPFIRGEETDILFVETLALSIAKGLRQADREKNTENINSSCDFIEFLISTECPIFLQLKSISSILNSIFDIDKNKISSDIIEKILNKISTVSHNDQIDASIPEMLKNCGLYFAHHKSKVVSILHQLLSQCTKFDIRLLISQSLSLLKDVDNTMNLIQRRDRILQNPGEMDLTLSFLDSYVVNSLKNGEKVKLPDQNKSSKCIGQGLMGKKYDDSSSAASMRSSFGRESELSMETMSTLSIRRDGNTSLMSSSEYTKPVWTPSGRIEAVDEFAIAETFESDNKNLSEDVNICCPVEIAQEANEESVNDKSSAEIEEDEKQDLTKAILKGFGLYRKYDDG